MNETFFLLALTRLTFLTNAEKELVKKETQNLDVLSKLSLLDLSFIVQRRLKPKNFTDLSCLPMMVEHDIRLMKHYDIKFIAKEASQYPVLLKEIYDPPLILFFRGVLPYVDANLVSIVGTRTPTGNGVVVASRLAKEFALAGIPVVSGLARGIDTFAHRSNLDNGAPTIGVLACGLDHLYPRSNCVLAGKIIQQGGCIISEYSPGEPAHKYRFPQRNQIIAGLSRATIVVEAPKNSGALITAEFALDQGRDVYVCKETMHSIKSEGLRQLKEEGAVPIVSAQEVLDSWNAFSYVRNKQKTQNKQKKVSTTEIGAQLALEFKNKIFHY